MENSKKIMWYNLAFMAFSTVWGFGNVVNGFAYFNGIQVIFSWILMFALYFVPYALMVGELGSAFKEAGGGVSSWIHETMGPKLAYYAGWTYWVVHIPYIASKGTGAIKAFSWLAYQDGAVLNERLSIFQVQGITLIIFLTFAFIASKGINPLKRLTTIAGSSMFVMSILFIVLMMAAPAINPDGGYKTIDWSLNNLIPTFDIKYFTSLSILVFAVGGCEKISPYVNKVEDPSKGFPKGMITLAIMVVICAILGSVSLAMMFEAPTGDANISVFVGNGAYEAFQKLGEYYGIGNFFMLVYAACNLVGQLSVLLLSIDAPLRMLLDNEDVKEFVPSALVKKNKHGAYINGIWLVVATVTPLIVIPALGVGNVDEVIQLLTKLNSVCMPLRYLWVFLAYIAMRKAFEKFPAEYRFAKSQGVAKFFGWWCFIVTAACCALGMYVEGDTFRTTLNIVTPIVLVGLGVIMPLIARKEKA